jgi:hypothetical protein
MNRADVALVNNQLDELGNAFLRNRQLEQEKNIRQQEADAATMRAQGDLEFRKAQQQHYNQIEDKQSDLDKLRQNQLAAQQKQGLFQSVVALNATGQLSDDARDDFNDWLAADEHFGPTGLQIKVPDNPNTKNKDAAVVNAIKSAKQYRDLAKAASDPDQAAEFNSYADKLEAWVTKQGEFKPAEGFEETTTKPTIDPLTGKQTGVSTATKRRTPIPAGPAATSTRQSSNPLDLFSQAKSAIAGGKDPAAVKTRFKTLTGQDFDAFNPTNAPAIGVPGMGSAQGDPGDDSD